MPRLGRKFSSPTGFSADLVDHDTVHLARVAGGQEPLHRRTFHIAAGEAAVAVISGRQTQPALRRLAMTASRGSAGESMFVDRKKGQNRSRR
jgi:hypothetical protein